MWHTSAASQRLVLPPGQLREVCYQALVGVGDAALGQWEESTAAAFHLRRRLSAEEEALVGPVVDVRGTSEAVQRVWAVRKWVMAAGPGAREVAAAEVEGR